MTVTSPEPGNNVYDDDNKNSKTSTSSLIARMLFSPRQTSNTSRQNNPEETSLESGNKKIGFFSRLFSNHHSSSPGHVQNERSPLLESSEYDPLASAEHTSNTVPTKRFWKKLTDNVNRGNFLIQAATMEATPDQKRKEALTKIQKHMDFTLGQCLLAIVVYVAVAVVFFSFILDRWSIIDSIYFAEVTFTTIGYGDVFPDTAAGRVFTSFFALSGVAFLGIALGVVGNNVIEAQEKAVAQTSQMAQFQVLSLFQESERPPSAVVQENQQPEAEPTSATRKVLYECVFILAILAIFALLVANDPGIGVGWNIGDALYYAIVTSTTIGYGDFSPATPEGRLVAIFFIPLAVGGMGHLLSIVSSTVIDAKQARVRQQMHQQELTLDDLEIMDADGDGLVTQAEFYEFMLLAMNKVDKELVDELRSHFARLDLDKSGYLSKEDLIAVARNKLQSPQRKLELARYKQQLLEQVKQGHHRRGGSSGSWGSGTIDLFQRFSKTDETNGVV